MFSKIMRVAVRHVSYCTNESGRGFGSGDVRVLRDAGICVSLWGKEGANMSALHFFGHTSSDRGFKISVWIICKTKGNSLSVFQKGPILVRTFRVYNVFIANDRIQFPLTLLLFTLQGGTFKSHQGRCSLTKRCFCCTSVLPSKSHEIGRAGSIFTPWNIILQRCSILKNVQFYHLFAIVYCLSGLSEHGARSKIPAIRCCGDQVLWPRHYE